MKNIDILLEQLKDQNIHLSLKNGKISVKSTGSKLSSEITGIIKDNKSEILKYLKDESDYKIFESIYPLSPMQEGMLFHSLYSPNSEVYMTQMSVDFVGELNISAFNTAWQAVIEKHTIFRTSFVSDNVSRPLQRVHQFVRCNIEIFDFVEFKGDEKQTKLATLLENERINGFDLTKAPLSKFKLVKVSENKHCFIWTHHHILLDGWCLPIVFKEFYENYQTICNGEEIKIGNIDKYEDFIYYLEEQDKGKVEEFWKDYLKGFKDPTPIPIGNNNQKPDETNTYKNNEITLGIEDTKLLNDFCKEHHLTVNTLVQSAWSLILSRYSGENDVVFGMTVSGRPASLTGVEEKIGLFINTLPLRVKLNGKINVIEWLKDLQEQQTLLREYEYMPLVNIQSLSDVSNRENLFNSILVFENYPIGETGNKKKSSLSIENVQSFEKTNYPLTISASFSNGLAINIAYNSATYSPETIEQILGHFREVLLNVVKHTENSVSDIEFLTSEEKHQLLVEWNDTEEEYPEDKCIHQLFEQQVEKTPANIAVVFEEEELTYIELNEKSNQLAHYLQSKGVRPGSLVGICVDRSLEMIIGLLGIMKAGGAYVPIDLTNPEDRISYVIEDADCEIVLSQGHLKLPKIKSKIIYLDADWDKIKNEPTENVKSAVERNNLAYVIYTSGSTGRPKGVMIEHKNTVSMLEWAKTNYNTDELKGVLASTSINFDLSVFEVFLPLSTSNTIILVNNILSYSDSINRDRVSLINTVPSAIKQLISDNIILDSVKVINLAGEKLKQEVVEKLYSLKSSLKVFDLYGPSEDTTYSTFSLRKVNGFYTIGRPITNTSIFILTNDFNIVPVGVVGELCISGDGLGRGYLKRPELTAEKFIKNPFSDDANSRLYKTGDLARYLPDGNIEFIGRIDNQVKIRGFRIELGEIESVLNKIETVKDCVLVAKDDAGGNKRLVAYVVSDDEINVQEIRDSLSKSLPDYMVPALFVKLETMPLTPNGKIDRKALPEPEGNIKTINEYVAPRNETEQKLAEIWTKVLGVEKVGIYDNFFELGGHSLNLMMINSIIEKEFDVKIKLKTFFNNPTISEMGKNIKILILSKKIIPEGIDSNKITI